jgi:hypothetical protein
MPVLQRPFAGLRQCSGLSRHTAVTVEARRQGGWDSRNRRSSSGKGSQNDGSFRFKFNQVDVALAEDQLWKLALPFAALFGLAIFIGPLVVGLTLSAIAVGAAFSAGAIAFTTFILPMVILMSIGGLASFGLFAGLGAMFVLPKLLFSALSLAIVGGGLALGWGGVNWVLSQQSSNKSMSSFLGGNSSNASSEEEEEAERLEEQRRQQERQIASELRQFDELLESKERQRRRQY